MYVVSPDKNKRALLIIVRLNEGSIMFHNGVRPNYGGVGPKMTRAEVYNLKRI